jgi:uncharacterized membrane protein YgdD (TMEM256/DUF423 family)
MKNKNILLFTIGMLAFTVLQGAFGAHALKKIVTSESIEIYKTGVLYQFIHLIGILSILVLSQIINIKKRSIIVLYLGILFFSGSLYLLSVINYIAIPVKFIGPITPIGGLLFVIGWIILMIDISKSK